MEGGTSGLLAGRGKNSRFISGDFFFSFGCEMEVDLMIHRGYQDDGSENRTFLFIKSLNGSHLQT